MAKINVSIDDELLARLDNVADANYQTRSGLISLAVAQYCNANEVISLVRSMSMAMQKIADKGELDDETIAQLEDFERMSKMLVGNK